MTNKNKTKMRNNRNRRRGKGQKGFHAGLVARNIDTYKIALRRPITYMASVYVGSTGAYSFTTAADIRYLDYATIFTSTEFTQLSNVFDQFRLIGATVSVNYTGLAPNANAGFHPLYMVTSAGGTPTTNPTATDVYYSDQARCFTYDRNRLQQVEFDFAAPSFNTVGVWIDVSLLPSYGLFQIANQPVSMGATTAFPVFDIRVDMHVEFANSK